MKGSSVVKTILIITTSVCISVVIFMLFLTVLEVRLRPHIEILNTEGYDHLFGLDYGYVVHVDLHNKGRSGVAIVGVDLEKGNEKFSKSQAIYFKDNESKNITFEFLEPELKLSKSERGFFEVRVVSLRR